LLFKVSLNQILNVMRYIFILTVLFGINQLSTQQTMLAQSNADFTGKWEGKLEQQGVELKVIFNVIEQNGTYTTTLDSPDQGAEEFPSSSTKIINNSIEIKADSIDMIFKGELDESGMIKGIFKQGSNSLPLNLSKDNEEKTEVQSRPQDPKDFPYQQEEVKFKNQETGDYLAGTLTIPESGDFDKVVILISGSGPQDRNEEITAFNHRPFLVLSDYLTKKGIAVLRYDDRGVGESEGDFDSATSKDFATDVSAAVDFLAQRLDMEDKKIGLAGHSEGGMIAPMVAAEHDKVDFLVLMAGPGIPVKELMMLQSEGMGAASGTPKDILEANLAVLEKAYHYLSEDNNEPKAKVKANLKKIFEDNFDLFPESAQNSIADKDAFFDGQVEDMTNDWFLYFIRYNPEQYLSKVECPLLAINGAKDLQVTSKENLEGIKAIMDKTNNKKVIIHEFENLNHLFQQCETGSVAEYPKIEETFNIATMQYIAYWINNLALK